MEMRGKLPNLGGIGYIEDPVAVAKNLFSLAMVSMYSQSTIYLGNVTSIAYSVHKGGDDVNAIIDNLERALTGLYGRYFYYVECKISDVTNNDSSNVSLNIRLDYGDDTDHRILEEAIDMNDGVIDLSNYGLGRSYR